MATIKSHTDLPQSKKLTEILPLESADMEYLSIKENGKLVGGVPFVKDDSEVEDSAYSYTYDKIACWSLSALLGVLPQGYSLGNKKSNGKYYICMTCVKHDVIEYDNPIDACYEMVIRLNELNLL